MSDTVAPLYLSINSNDFTNAKLEVVTSLLRKICLLGYEAMLIGK
jgi:hypothetical protein